MARRIRSQHLQARESFALRPLDTDNAFPAEAVRSKPQVSDRPDLHDKRLDDRDVRAARRPGPQQLDAMEPSISSEQLSLLTETSRDVLAFQVADLALRMAKLDPAQLSERQIKGVEALDQMMRMIEHLNILKSDPDAQ